jgi:hypothetical protein
MFLEHKEDEERQRLIKSICSKCFLTESPSVEMTAPVDKETIQDEERQKQRHIYVLIDSPSKKLEVEMALPEVLQVDNKTLHDRFSELYKQEEWLNWTEERLKEALEKLLKEE